MTNAERNLPSEDHIKQFKNDTLVGPIYPCICCDRTRFINGVKTFTDEDLIKLERTLGEELFNSSLNLQTFALNGLYYMYIQIESGNYDSVVTTLVVGVSVNTDALVMCLCIWMDIWKGKAYIIFICQ